MQATRLGEKEDEARDVEEEQDHDDLLPASPGMLKEDDTDTVDDTDTEDDADMDDGDDTGCEEEYGSLVVGLESSNVIQEH
jgi:hypothetical protein